MYIEASYCRESAVDHQLLIRHYLKLIESSDRRAEYDGKNTNR